MITVSQIDHLVVSNDGVASRIWPRLGPRVRQAYTADRDAWAVLRRKLEAGETLPPPTLVAQHKVFAGWARAFRAASSRPKRAPAPPLARSAAVTAAASALAAPSPVAVPLAAAIPALPKVPKPSSGAGTAVAGGLLLAGLVAVAARRKRT